MSGTSSDPRQRISKRPRRDTGSILVETALTLPMLILMACVTMDVARVFFAGVVVESAARAGVQYGSYSAGKAGAISAMNTAAQNDASGQGLTGIGMSSRTFCACNTGTGEVDCATGTCSGATPSGYVETTASYTFTPIVPYPGFPANIPISASAKFRVQ